MTAPELLPWCTEYRVPHPDYAHGQPFADTIWAPTREAAEALCEARHPGNEVVMGQLLAEYAECDECHELIGTHYDGDESNTGHAPQCNRQWIPAPPVIPERM